MTTATPEAIATQRAGLGALGFAFGPNLGSVDYRDLFRRPDAWADLRGQISAFKVYAGNVSADEPSDAVGANTYPALVEVEAFRKLREWNLPLHLEHGAVKEWEPADAKGQQLRAPTLEAIRRIRAAGGEVAMVCMDEPLTSTVNGDGENTPGKLDVGRVGDVARYTAEYAKPVRDAGAIVSLLEAYPHHPAVRIEAFLRHVVDDNKVPLGFFELDIDLFALKNQRINDDRASSDLRLLRQTCRERNIPFRVIATGTHARSPKEYRSETLEVARRAQKIAAPVDGVTVQSWVEHNLRRDIPSNLPSSGEPSHLSLLAEVFALRLL
jgi:hypothetical protein